MRFYYLPVLFILLSCSSNGQKSDSLGNFGKASFYHDGLHGFETSNGEFYNKNDFTAAHRTYPFNTILLVTNKKNNKSVVVRVNDRGPFVRSRVIDLSHSAAKKIGMVPFGVVQVKIKVLNFLNPRLMNDTLLRDGEVWDCYGNRKELRDTSILIWRTDSWKHAFYMASCLSLEYKIDSMLVKVVGPIEKRYYELFISASDNLLNRSKIISILKSDGFFESCLIYSSSKASRQPDDQSSK